MLSANRVSRLEEIYILLHETIMKYQHPVTAFLPAAILAGTDDSIMKDAWIRDNVYGVIAPWALSIAYSKIKNDKTACRVQELENFCVKLMRSLLKSMMKQSSKIEKFKKTLDPKDSIHAKFCHETGDAVVGDLEWGHFQIDAVSLYILILAEMIASGLKIIYTLDEVDFVQNLVFYVETAYKTPDYGIWERGDKTNHGLPELNTASIGMAKAALETLKDFNLFGASGGPSSIIHVHPDNIHRCNTILEAMLPRESCSKEIGASILTVIGYPAFAVDDKAVVSSITDEIISKLEGRYGFVRFLRDGYRTVREDPGRLHYEQSELNKFEHIECEWPMFFAFMLISAIFTDDPERATYYYKKLTSVMIKKDDKDFPVMPQLYYVPTESVEKECKNPHTQDRLPSDRQPTIWGQSLYIVATLLYERFVTPAELDPVNRRRSFTLKNIDVVQIAFLAEDVESVNILSHMHIPAQHVDDIVDIKILPTEGLKKIYGHLGENSKLGLTGRYCRDIEIISTCTFYKTENAIYGMYPEFIQKTSFYLQWDQNFIIDTLGAELEYLRKNWKMSGRPTIMIPINSTMLSAETDNYFLDAIKRLHSGNYYGIRVCVNYLNELLTTASVINIEFIPTGNVEKILAAIDGRNSRYNRRRSFLVQTYDVSKITLDQSLSQVRAKIRLSFNSAKINFFKIYGGNKREVQTQPPGVLVRQLEDASLVDRLNILLELYMQFGPDYELVLQGAGYQGTLGSVLNDLYHQMCVQRIWIPVRLIAACERKTVENISLYCLDIIVREKQVTIGYMGSEEKVIDRPLSNEELFEMIRTVYKEDVISALLIQEFFVYISFLIKTYPKLFNEMLRIRIGLILTVTLYEFAKILKLKDDEVLQHFFSLEPSQIKKLLYFILSGKEFDLKIINGMVTMITHEERVSRTSVSNSAFLLKNLNLDHDGADSESMPGKILGLWYRRRSLDGALNRVPSDFFYKTWNLINKCNGLYIGSDVLENEISKEMTPRELKFALRVETSLNMLPDPEYRQLAVEVIIMMATMLNSLTNFEFLCERISIDDLIINANEFFLIAQAMLTGDAISCCAGRDKKNRRCNGYNQICRFFYDSAPSGQYGTMNYMCQALMSYLESRNICNFNDICRIT